MGKTAVFVLTVLNTLGENPPMGSCLVLAHTRELAYQIAKEFDRFSCNLQYKTMVIYGGEPLDDQVDKLNADKPPIIVATPGRLLALIKKKILDLKNNRIFILDECDKMLKELGKLIFNFFRYESRCSINFHGHTTEETSYDVLSYTTERY
jgi:superfamily II DNA/RNA helicase